MSFISTHLSGIVYINEAHTYRKGVCTLWKKLKPKGNHTPCNIAHVYAYGT